MLKPARLFVAGVLLSVLITSRGSGRGGANASRKEGSAKTDRKKGHATRRVWSIYHGARKCAAHYALFLVSLIRNDGDTAKCVKKKNRKRREKKNSSSHPFFPSRWGGSGLTLLRAVTSRACSIISNPSDWQTRRSLLARWFRGPRGDSLISRLAAETEKVRQRKGRISRRGVLCGREFSLLSQRQHRYTRVIEITSLSLFIVSSFSFCFVIIIIVLHNIQCRGTSELKSPRHCTKALLNSYPDVSFLYLAIVYLQEGRERERETCMVYIYICTCIDCS